MEGGCPSKNKIWGDASRYRLLYELGNSPLQRVFFAGFALTFWCPYMGVGTHIAYDGWGGEGVSSLLNTPFREATLFRESVILPVYSSSIDGSLGWVPYRSSRLTEPPLAYDISCHGVIMC